jgi:hypothetical protein
VQSDAQSFAVAMSPRETLAITELLKQQYAAGWMFM